MSAVSPKPSTILSSCPAASEQRVAIHIAPAAERQLRQGHPWLYDQAIRRQSHAGRPGDLAVIYDRRERFLAIGLYDPTSPIRVRVLRHRAPAPIDRAWYQARLRDAAQRRASLADSETNAYRLVHGENDGLPGLIVDRYGETLVLKLYTVAWIVHLRELLAVLPTIHPAQRVLMRLARSVQRQPRFLYGLRMLFVESLNVSVRYGCQAKACQMRQMAVWLNPLRWAMPRVLQCVASRGVDSNVSVSTRSIAHQ